MILFLKWFNLTVKSGRKLTGRLLAWRHNSGMGSSRGLGPSIMVSRDIWQIFSTASHRMVRHVCRYLLLSFVVWTWASIGGIAYWDRRTIHLSGAWRLCWFIITAWSSPSMLSDWANRYYWVKYPSLNVWRAMKGSLRQFNLNLRLGSNCRL